MRILLTVIVVCLSAAALAGCGSAQAIKPEDVVVGNTIPDFSLETLDGKKMTKDSLKGEVVILNFWATWCAPCMVEIPELKEVAASQRAKVVGIALDETGRKTIEPFAKTHQMNYPVLVGDQDTFQQFNGVGIPYTLVLDRSQRIVKVYRGPATKQQLEEDLRGIEQRAS